MTNIVKNKNGIEFDIDAIATDLNGKMDRDGVNAECPTLLSRTPNNQGGVIEIWSDGYCVQTGIVTDGSQTTVTLDVPYKDTNYKVFLILTINGPTNYEVRAFTTTSFNWYWTRTSSSWVFQDMRWRAEGYIR